MVRVGIPVGSKNNEADGVCEREEVKMIRISHSLRFHKYP